MIRINLLPTKRKKKSKPLPMYLIYSGVTLILSLAVLFFVNSYMGSRIKALEKEQSTKQAELKRLDALIKHVKDFKSKQDDLKKRIDVILAIAEKKAMPAKLFDEMARRLTSGIWLTAIKYSRDKLQLTGVGFNNADIVTYVEHLKDTDKIKLYPASPIQFTTVKLHGTQKVSIKEQTVYNFNITMGVNMVKEKTEGEEGS